MDTTSKAEQIAETHRVSAERGRALLALATEQNDIGGHPEHADLTAMSAIVDLMHAVADLGVVPADTLTLANHRYAADTTGEW